MIGKSPRLDRRAIQETESLPLAEQAAEPAEQAALATRVAALMRHMRPARRRRQRTGHAVPARILSSDQPPLQGNDLADGLRQRKPCELDGGRLGILPGFGSTQGIDHPHRLLGIERRTAAPQRDGFLAPGACEVRLSGVIGDPGRLQRRLGRRVKSTRLLEDMGPGEEATGERRVGSVLDQRTKRRR